MMFSAFIGSISEVFIAVASLFVAWRGARELKETVADKRELIAKTRGSVLLQESVVVKLEDGVLDDEEIRDLAIEIEALVTELDIEVARRKRLINMIRHARSNQAKSRFLKEIAFEIADEAHEKS